MSPLTIAIAALKRGDGAAIEAFRPHIVQWLEELQRHRGRDAKSDPKTTDQKPAGHD